MLILRIYLISNIFIINPSTNQDLVLKDYLPLISSSVVIVLFIVERFLSYRIRKRERETNWYYKVFIDPNIEKINSFFDETAGLYKDSSKKIKSIIGVHNITDYKSNEIGKFQLRKREFENGILLPIISSYSEIGNNLTEELLNIEDLYTEILDKVNSDETYQAEFVIRISLSKATFYKLLFKPINREGRFKRLRLYFASTFKLKKESI